MIRCTSFSDMPSVIIRKLCRLTPWPLPLAAAGLGAARDVTARHSNATAARAGPDRSNIPERDIGVSSSSDQGTNKGGYGGRVFHRRIYPPRKRFARNYRT